MPHLILTPLSNPLRAGGLFHFKKDHADYSIEAEDYETKPLFVSSKENH